MRWNLGLFASLALLGGACGSGGAPSSGELDLVVLGGRIVDGTGAAWFYGDLGIRGDRIARITPRGLLADAPARERIDAEGRVVAPGFIDIQSHSRRAFLSGDGRVISKVTQGITTEILGEGGTNAPANEKTRALAGLEPEDFQESFASERGFDAWLRAMETHGISANVGSFLGATTVRVYAKGEEMGKASDEELDVMRRITREAMEDGAFGVASALIYPPGNFASTEELIEVAKAMSPYGGVYITHMRSEADQFLEAIEEAVRIGREGGVPVEIYHLKATGQRNWPKMREAIALIDRSRSEGIDVQANMYPYVAGGTGVAALLPPWASADGKLLENLRDLEKRKQIHDEVLAPSNEWENLGQLATPEGILIVDGGSQANERFEGKRLSGIASELGVDWVDAAIEILLAAERRAGMVVFGMDEANVALQMQQPWIKFGTDAGGYDPDNVEGLAHPRAYGTFPRILGKYVREEKVLTIEDAIRKMSSAVAARLSIEDRGLLKEGFYADVVVFDPATVADRATFEAPHVLSTGIEHVFVNGVAVVRDGKHTGAKPGRIVRGPGYHRAETKR
jgi:dihydroorotase/N-acyl-D-amino-acid deacylase